MNNARWSLHSPRRRRVLLGTAALACLAGARSSAQPAPKPLTVGGLPVTCNLTLPVACKASELDPAAATRGPLFEFNKYSGWPELKESLMSGRLQAAYMLAPLIMDLANSSIPVKVVSLGHRSGAVIMVRRDSPYRTFRDLTRKRV